MVFGHLYSTKPWNADTGLYYYGYRYYHPRSGRWISRDPIAEDGGLNLFGFCSNDSVNSYDWMGFGENPAFSRTAKIEFDKDNWHFHPDSYQANLGQKFKYYFIEFADRGEVACEDARHNAENRSHAVFGSDIVYYGERIYCSFGEFSNFAVGSLSRFVRSQERALYEQNKNVGERSVADVNLAVASVSIDTIDAIKLAPGYFSGVMSDPSLGREANYDKAELLFSGAGLHRLAAMARKMNPQSVRYPDQVRPSPYHSGIAQDSRYILPSDPAKLKAIREKIVSIGREVRKRRGQFTDKPLQKNKKGLGLDEDGVRFRKDGPRLGDDVYLGQAFTYLRFNL